MTSRKISFAQARQIAENEATLLLGRGGQSSSDEILDPNFMSRPEFWIFFRNKKIFYPPESNLAASAAYLVSKRGSLRTVADFSGDLMQMRSLIESLDRAFSEGKLN